MDRRWNPAIRALRKVKSQYTIQISSLTTTSASNSKRVFAYPLPTSFPRSIIPSQSIRPREPKGIFSRSPSTTALSSLTTTARTGSLLNRYATFIESFVLRKLDLGSVGARIEMDDVRELNSELWAVFGGYSEGDGGGEAVRGEVEDEHEW